MNRFKKNKMMIKTKWYWEIGVEARRWRTYGPSSFLEKSSESPTSLTPTSVQPNLSSEDSHSRFSALWPWPSLRIWSHLVTVRLHYDPKLFPSGEQGESHGLGESAFLYTLSEKEWRSWKGDLIQVEPKCTLRKMNGNKRLEVATWTSTFKVTKAWLC